MPVRPGGQSPQRGPDRVSVHSTPGKQGPSAQLTCRHPSLVPSPEGSMEWGETMYNSSTTFSLTLCRMLVLICIVTVQDHSLQKGTKVHSL